MKHLSTTVLAIAALFSAPVGAVSLTVDFEKAIAPLRPELHSSGFGPLFCTWGTNNIATADVKSMGFKAARTHDWALVNRAERVCDYYHIFPLMHLDAKDPKNYHFGPTDHLLRSCRVWVHDDKRDLEEISVPVKDGRLVLEKPDELSAAYLVREAGN